VELLKRAKKIPAALLVSLYGSIMNGCRTGYSVRSRSQIARAPQGPTDPPLAQRTFAFKGESRRWPGDKPRPPRLTRDERTLSVCPIGIVCGYPYLTIGTRMRRSGGGSTSQTAIRVLFVLDRCATPVSDVPDVAGAVKVLHSETKLQKLDFWVRNPDYLADELLTEGEEGRIPLDEAIDEARIMLAEPPALHLYPMTRYLRGAYERKDNALAILKSLGHVTVRRLPSQTMLHRARRDFYLLEKGAEAVATLRATFPELKWYDDQATRAGTFATALTGAQCKDRQYANAFYEGTPLGAPIPSIRGEVMERVHRLAGESNAQRGD
jgi:hypothetical protein